MVQSVLTSGASTAQHALYRAVYPSHMRYMGRHENVAPGPSWTVVIVAQPSPLLHTAIASDFCTAPGRVLGHISPSPHNGRFLIVPTSVPDLTRALEAHTAGYERHVNRDPIGTAPARKFTLGYASNAQQECWTFKGSHPYPCRLKLGPLDGWRHRPEGFPLLRDATPCSQPSDLVPRELPPSASAIHRLYFGHSR